MIFYVAQLMPQYNLEVNQIVTWSLPNSVTGKTIDQNLSFTMKTLFLSEYLALSTS